MMKLSHESKRRLGVGIGAFVLIIGLVFGTSRTIGSFRYGAYDRTVFYLAICLILTICLTRTIFEWRYLFRSASAAFERNL